MTRSIDASRPAQRRLGFAGNRLHRDGENRTDETLSAALRHSGARVYLTARGQWLCRGEVDRPDPSFGVDEAAELGGGAALDFVLLGQMPDGAPRLAAALPAPAANTNADGPESLQDFAGAMALDLRTLGMKHLLEPDIEGQLAQAAHLLTWNRRSRFCGLCGGETASEAAGFRRRCTACGELHFPRTDPVSIMLIHDGEGSCVLGRQPHFPENFWSCLAGFVEAGETIEDAVRRETKEEAGLDVGEVSYRTSQPWPFPNSLMIGCTALALTREITFDGNELEDCRWFSRAEILRMLAGTHETGLVAPHTYAIAHHLVRAFADGAVGGQDQVKVG